MERMTVARYGAIAAGAGFLVEGVLAFAHRSAGLDGAVYDHALDAAYAVAVFGAAAGLGGLIQALGLGRVGRWGTRLAQFGCIAMGVESAAGALFGRIDALGPLFGIGILAALIGMIVVAVTGLISGRIRWAAALPLLALVVAAAGGGVGASVMSGAAWFALAAWALRESEQNLAPATAALGRS